MYYQYDNEWVYNYVNSGLGDILLKPLSTTTTSYVYSVVDMCQLSGNCGEASLEACTTTVLQSNTCSTLSLPTTINWYRSCEGSAVDLVDWPMPRPGQLSGGDLTSNAMEEIKPDLQLGQSQPNPGRSTIQIPYYLPEESGSTELWISEVTTGKELGKMILPKYGNGMMDINLSTYSSGVYAYRLIPTNGKPSQTRKFVVIR